MSFTLPGGFICDRIVDAIGRNSKGEMLYNLVNIKEGSIEITAETKDATDATGALVKRFYNAKTGTVSLSQAFMSLEALAATTGSKAEIGSTDKKVRMPKIVHVAKGTTEVAMADVVEGTIRVEGVSASGGRVESYTLGATAAEAKAFKYDATNKKLTLPTGAAAEVATFLIHFECLKENAVAIANRANEFAKPHQLTLRVLGTEPCNPDITRALYVVVNNFQPSPEQTVSFQTDSAQDLKGDMLTAYCGADKTLFTVYYADEEEA